MKKKVLSVLLSMTMVAAVLSGCGGAAADTAAPAADAAAPADDAAAPADDAAVLRILPHLQLMHLQLRTQLLLQTQLLLTTQLLLIPQLQLMRRLMLLLQLHQAVEGLQLQCLHSHQRDGSMTAQT